MRTAARSRSCGPGLEPEGSISALVDHHLEARYFSLTADDTEVLECRVLALEGVPAR